MHNFKAVVATDFKPGTIILQSLSTLAENFAPRPLPVWAWRSGLLHAVEKRSFYASLWSSTISGKNIARLPKVRFLSRRVGVLTNQE